MSYVTLGARSQTATLDTTGQNTGNFTNWFSGQVMGGNVPFFEVYHAIVTSVPAGANATIQVGTAQWSFTSPGAGGGSEWDPTQPMLLRPGDDVFFFWSTGTGTAPMVTLWLRFDPAIPANARYAS